MMKEVVQVGRFSGVVERARRFRRAVVRANLGASKCARKRIRIGRNSWPHKCSAINFLVAAASAVFPRFGARSRPAFNLKASAVARGTKRSTSC